jgi:hypothetical protein
VCRFRVCFLSSNRDSQPLPGGKDLCGCGEGVGLSWGSNPGTAPPVIKDLLNRPWNTLAVIAAWRGGDLCCIYGVAWTHLAFTCGDWVTRYIQISHSKQLSPHQSVSITLFLRGCRAKFSLSKGTMVFRLETYVQREPKISRISMDTILTPNIIVHFYNFTC